MTESKPEHATAWPACRRTGRWTDRIGTGTRTRDCLTCLWQNWQVNWSNRYQNTWLPDLLVAELAGELVNWSNRNQNMWLLDLLVAELAGELLSQMNAAHVCPPVGLLLRRIRAKVALVPNRQANLTELLRYPLYNFYLSNSRVSDPTDPEHCLNWSFIYFFNGAVTLVRYRVHNIMANLDIGSVK
jgi:hypothetical protein